MPSAALFILRAHYAVRCIILTRIWTMQAVIEPALYCPQVLACCLIEVALTGRAARAALQSCHG